MNLCIFIKSSNTKSSRSFVLTILIYFRNLKKEYNAYYMSNKIATMKAFFHFDTNVKVDIT